MVEPVVVPVPVPVVVPVVPVPVVPVPVVGVPVLPGLLGKEHPVTIVVGGFALGAATPLKLQVPPASFLFWK